MTASIIERIKDAGVVGAGGAGFPTHIKLNAKVDHVLVNGAECEPLLRANQQMLSKYSREIWSALQQVLDQTQASHGIIALKKKYEQAVTVLKTGKPADNRLGIFSLEDFYPAGDEHILVYETTGRIVPEGGIPLQVGCVVINVETLYNVFIAIEGQPVTRKFVTITGAVNKPQTVAVPIGTKYSRLIDLAGGPSVRNYSIISGGPMMGDLADPAGVVTKTTGGIILLPSNHPLVRYKNSAISNVVLRARAVCCQCRACTDLCPRYLQGHNLEPHKIMRSLGAGNINQYITNAYLCSECGVCDRFACPMDLAPRTINKLFKEEMLKSGVKNPHHESPSSARIFREIHKVPSSRLIMRLGLEIYNSPAPLVDSAVTPDEVQIPLRQHIGKRAIPLVKPGDYVKAGDLIGEIPQDSLIGANIHASLDGTVISVNDSIQIKGY